MVNASVVAGIRNFVDARDWDRFHLAENLAKSIAIEAGELLECFQWDSEPAIGAVASELADVLTYCYLLGAKLGLDLDQIVLDKLEVSEAKYPIEKARGRSSRYDQLPG
ncbi:MAG: nucleotide pyrophosphohydrolase [Frankiaceae bacterium]|nr:nucleotide pyrophosphohydrolase [Frankiaceae bacterium]